jgi:cation diffusion facilitator family transporter
MLVGWNILSDSVEKILDPEITTEFSWLMIIVLGISVLVKLWLCLFNRRLADKIGSSVMKATAADSLSDAIATAAVLVAMLVFKFTGFDADGYMGIAVAVVIFIAGIKILNDTKNSILGTKPDDQTVAAIREVVERFPEAIGIHDMVIHNYGPCRTLATLHVEVDGKKDIFASHDAVDNMERILREEHSIECSIHLDPIVVDDPLVEEWRVRTQQLARVIDERILLHDFRVVPGTSHTNLLFDMAVPFEIKESDEELKKKMAMAVAALAPNFYTVITIDRV